MEACARALSQMHLRIDSCVVMTFVGQSRPCFLEHGCTTRVSASPLPHALRRDAPCAARVGRAVLGSVEEPLVLGRLVLLLLLELVCAHLGTTVEVAVAESCLTPTLEMESATSLVDAKSYHMNWPHGPFHFPC
jgi:hypothetical protein